MFQGHFEGNKKGSGENPLNPCCRWWVILGSNQRPLPCEDAEIDNFRRHDMRHNFAGRPIMAGVDLNTAREPLGHSDLKMTLRYAHLAPEAKQRAVEELD